MKINKLAVLSAVIWSVAVVILAAFALGVVLSDLNQALSVLAKALGGQP